MLNDPKAQSDWLKVDGMDALVELALNLHWSWNHSADELWEELDKELWVTTQNPWVILRTVSRERIKAELAAPEFRRSLDNLLRKNRESFQADAWFQHRHPDAAITTIAYFSMDSCLSEALPIYSGGLGNVAGDQLKAASDLGVTRSKRSRSFGNADDQSRNHGTGAETPGCSGSSRLEPGGKERASHWSIQRKAQ